MKARKSLLVLTIGVLLVSLLWATVPARAFEPPPAIQFADESAVEVKWPEAIRFEVLNNTTETLQLSLRFSEFETEDGEKTLNLEGILKNFDPQKLFTLPPAGILPFEVPIDSGKALEAGAYTGTLIVSEATRDIVIRKTVELTVPDPDDKEAALLTPGVSALTVTVYRLWPLVYVKQDLSCSRNCYLPIEKISGEFSRSKQIGYISSDTGGVIRVSVDEYSAEKGARLKLDFPDSLSRVGKYSGKLDFLPDDEKAGDVTLTVNVTDCILWPVLVLLAGIALVAWGQHYTGVHRKILVLLERHANAEKKFKALPQSIHGYKISTNLDEKFKELDTTLRGFDKAYFDKFDEEKKYTDAVAELESLEAQVDAWGKFDAKLTALKDALNKLKPVVDTAERPPAEALPDPDLQYPVFYTTASGLLEGKAITLDEFTKLQAEVEGATKLAGEWEELEGLAQWSRGRITVLRENYQSMTDKEKERLDEAHQSVNSAWFDLWLAKNEEQITASGARSEILIAKDAVWRLSHRFGAPTPEPPPLTMIRVFAYVPGMGLVEPPETAGEVRPAKHYAFMRIPLPEISLDQLPAEPEKRAVFARQAIHRGDKSILYIAIVTALVTGLAAVYFPKNFGTLADYLGALIWGGATKAAVEGVNAALGAIFSQRKMAK
ncbi:MAG: hypothetical protein AB1846_04505 [Chloroflexota bacterium]